MSAIFDLAEPLDRATALGEQADWQRALLGIPSRLLFDNGIVALRLVSLSAGEEIHMRDPLKGILTIGEGRLIYQWPRGARSAGPGTNCASRRERPGNSRR